MLTGRKKTLREPSFLGWTKMIGVDKDDCCRNTFCKCDVNSCRYAVAETLRSMEIAAGLLLQKHISVMKMAAGL